MLDYLSNAIDEMFKKNKLQINKMLEQIKKNRIALRESGEEYNSFFVPILVAAAIEKAITKAEVYWGETKTFWYAVIYGFM